MLWEGGWHPALELNVLKCRTKDQAIKGGSAGGQDSPASSYSIATSSPGDRLRPPLLGLCPLSLQLQAEPARGSLGLPEITPSWGPPRLLRSREQRFIPANVLVTCYCGSKRRGLGSNFRVIRAKSLSLSGTQFPRLDRG